MEEVMTDLKKEKKKRSQNQMVIINEEELIHQVEIRPVLYDKSLRGYRKSTLRDQSWRDIADLLSSSVEECRKRWRSLRDAFARHYKHVADDDPIGSTKKKKWLYYDQMYFLAPYLECSGPVDEKSEFAKIIQDNSQGTIIMDGEEPIEIEQTYKAEDRGSEQTESNHQQSDNQATEAEQTIDVYENQVMTRLFASPATYQIADCKSNKSSTDLTSENISDPDERFLLSCSPILKRLPAKKNALARLKIQQILYNIEFGEI